MNTTEFLFSFLHRKEDNLQKIYLLMRLKMVDFGATTRWNIMENMSSEGKKRDKGLLCTSILGSEEQNQFGNFRTGID